MMLRALLCAVMLATCGLLGAAEPSFDEAVPTRLVVLDYDKLKLRNEAQELLVDIVEQNEHQVVFSRIGSTIRETRQLKDVAWIEKRSTAEELMKHRSQELLAAHEHEHLRNKIQLEIPRAVEFARKHDLPGPAFDLLAQTVKQYPYNTDLAELAIEVGLELDKQEEVEQIAREVLELRPSWRAGYETLLAIFRERGDEDAIVALIDRWLDKLPTDLQANLLNARRAEQEGDLAVARESYRRAYELHDNADAGFAYARIQLGTGEYDEVLAAIDSLRGAGYDEQRLAAVEGATLMMLGRLTEAQELLEKSVAVDLGDEHLNTMTRYNLGYLYHRQGRDSAALEQWQGLDHPAAIFARHRVQREPIRDASVLSHPVLGSRARELNAALLLEEGQPEPAQRLLQPERYPRHAFLDKVALVQSDEYSEDALRQLAHHEGQESVLWQAYARIQRGEFAKAEELLQQLPEDHGYAAVYRVFCAEAQEEMERARELYATSRQSIDPPRDYLNLLEGFYFSQLGNVAQQEDFDWVEGEALATGWLKETPQTGVRIGINDGKLVFSGTQRASATPVNRAWRMRPQQGLRRIIGDLGIGANTYGGLELLSSDMESGFAIGSDPQQRLVLRRRRDGAWGQWQVVASDMPEQIDILFDPAASGLEQVKAKVDERRLEGIASLFELPTDEIAIGFFAFAQPGDEVDMAVESMRIQYNEQ